MKEDGFTLLKAVGLADDLVGDGVSHVADGIHVLHFHLGIELVRTPRPQ